MARLKSSHLPQPVRFTVHLSNTTNNFLRMTYFWFHLPNGDTSARCDKKSADKCALEHATMQLFEPEAERERGREIRRCLTFLNANNGRTWCAFAEDGQSTMFWP